MEARRRAAAESVREQQAFIAVLQAALYLPIPPLDLLCISPRSPLDLPYISAFIAVLQATLYLP